MYTPPWFSEEDKKTLVSFMREYPFASLISYAEDGPIASHLPLEFLADEREEHGVLVGHVARQNPHWRSFKSKNESLIIFSGPHEYISPSWYKSKSLVPTWNYAAVHAYGHIEVIEEEQRVRDILNLLIDRFESPRAEPWVNELDPDFMQKLQSSIVAFSFSINRLQGKFKLSQNRSQEDQRASLHGLLKEPSKPKETLAAFWQKRLEEHDL